MPIIFFSLVQNCSCLSSIGKQNWGLVRGEGIGLCHRNILHVAGDKARLPAFSISQPPPPTPPLLIRPPPAHKPSTAAGSMCTSCGQVLK
jgi:hypothetical protein